MRSSFGAHVERTERTERTERMLPLEWLSNNKAITLMKARELQKVHRLGKTEIVSTANVADTSQLNILTQYFDYSLNFNTDVSGFHMKKITGARWYLWVKLQKSSVNLIFTAVTAKYTGHKQKLKFLLTFIMVLIMEQISFIVNLVCPVVEECGRKAQCLESRYTTTQHTNSQKLQDQESNPQLLAHEVTVLRWPSEAQSRQPLEEVITWMVSIGQTSVIC